MSGDDFIHAENEKTGVVISSLNSDYYRKRYAGARRLL
jgi:cell wall-associated NlpC family hydrolase